VCEGIRSELDVIKDKVSNLDDYESGYEFSNNIICLNGTTIPSWDKTLSIVRVGKICILHGIIMNESSVPHGTILLKLPSFAHPKVHLRLNGTGKINDDVSNIVPMNYDIACNGDLTLYLESSKLNEMYLHAIWEVE
jgi:hypothetical protein